MGHASDGTLRRLVDEPFAIADSTFDHIARCARCRARGEAMAHTASVAARRLSAPQLVPDVDRAWSDFERRVGEPDRGVASRRPARASWPPRRLAGLSLRGGVLAASVAVVVAGSAAGATLSGVFAPTRVAPVAINAQDLRAVAGLMSLGDTGSPGGFPTASGSGSLPFGSLRWTSSGSARSVGSAAAAQAISGVRVVLPARLPAGVGAATTFVVQPRVTATVTFDAAAGKLAGASVVVHAGPAVFVGYGSRSGGSDIPAMGVLVTPRPTASSAGATIGQIERFLMSRPGIPPELAQEIRLLGNASTVLPIPAPKGMSATSVRVDGWPGVLMADPSGVMSGVVWEDGSGLVHMVAGLLGQKSVLDVAGQLR